MLVSGVPWQVAATMALLGTTLFLFCTVIAVGFAWLAWPAVIVLGGQCLGLFLLLGLIPVYLNLSRTFYSQLLILLAIHVGGSIVAYAFLYRSSGLIHATGISYDFRDALYFSVTTWTTLGYGDFTPPPNIRLVTSAEALLGTTSLALAVSFLWLWCSEALVPRDRAVLDGTKFDRRSATRHRLRIQTVRGLVRHLDDNYIDLPEPGTVMYWDKRKERWETLSPGAAIPPDADTIRFS